MGFDIESLGGGAGAGLISGILAVLGINRRMNKIEDCKQDIPVCDAKHKGIDEKFEIMVDLQKEIRERVDDLNNYVRGKK